MPTSAKRNQQGRRDLRKDNEPIPEDAPLDNSSPTRAIKRRKGPRFSDRSDSSPLNVVLPLSQTAEADSLPGANDDQLVAQITQQLKSQAVQASKDHANVIHEAKGDGVKAYAKVAAQDWTYYITKLTVNIGRAPEPLHGGVATEDNQESIHIDLGPSKMVSREHASISFDSKDEKWVLLIKGRNGAKIDGQLLKPQVAHPLTSGEVIEIGNVEMMFVLPSELSPLHVHSSFLQRCRLKTEASRATLPQDPTQNSPVLVNQRTPSTPPSTKRRSVDTGIKSPGTINTPAIGFGLSAVDLSQDDNQLIKPQYSYAQMITQAILNAPDGKLNLNGIYNFIMNSYSYYRHQHAAGWQNSIRHNLSLNKAFDKVARSTDEPGKGMKWHIVPEARDEMVRNAYKIGRGGHRGSSAPSSPSQLNYITHGPKDVVARDPVSARKRRASPLVSPSPRPSRHVLQSTPDQTSKGQLGGGANLTVDGSPLPRHKRSSVRDSFSEFHPQSPTLTSSYLQDDGAAFVTPAPPRVHPKLVPPSTAQRPSQHMPTSSPAPFWKYADIGSTPLKPLATFELSPSKAIRELPPPSSSPPGIGKSPPSSPSRPQKSSQQETVEAPDENEEGQGFDLMKGFQSIGAYHAPVGQGVSVAPAMRENI